MSRQDLASQTQNYHFYKYITTNIIWILPCFIICPEIVKSTIEVSFSPFKFYQHSFYISARDTMHKLSTISILVGCYFQRGRTINNVLLVTCYNMSNKRSIQFNKSPTLAYAMNEWCSSYFQLGDCNHCCIVCCTVCFFCTPHNNWSD